MTTTPDHSQNLFSSAAEARTFRERATAMLAVYADREIILDRLRTLPDNHPQRVAVILDGEAHLRYLTDLIALGLKHHPDPF